MKCVILAGGEGTRISEETRHIPKPMIRVGGVPLIRHIMGIYEKYGINEFIVPVGYKSEIITAYFLGYVDTRLNQVDGNLVFTNPDWTVTIVDTGRNTMTGGRIGKLRNLLGEDFCMTYGDGVSDVDVTRAIKIHKNKGNAVATITAVRPSPRFGSLEFVDEDSTSIIEFGEKIENLKGWINGGFMVLSPKIFDLIHFDDCNLEKDVFPQLAKQGAMYGVRHTGFWHCVDTLRDLLELEEIRNTKGAIWLE